MAFIQRCALVDHHKVDHTQGPYVGFKPINGRFSYLWSHCVPTSQCSGRQFLISVLYFLAEAKISDFEDSIVDEYVCWFEVAVDDVVAVEF